jgi:hypothetical protein
VRGGRAVTDAVAFQRAQRGPALFTTNIVCFKVTDAKGSAA